MKLFRAWCPSDWVDYEARIARAVYAAGIPSPAAGEIVEWNGRRGLIYERLDGISMLQDMNARPWTLFRHARSLADLQVQIHRRSIPGLPSYNERLNHDIRNAVQPGEGLRKKALTMLEGLPDGQNLCHGDYHPGNILLTRQGLVVIDWMTACSGSSWADVARTSLLLNIGAKSAGKQVNPAIQAAIGMYYRAYVRRYESVVPDTQKQRERWMPVIAAARLHEDIPGERDILIGMVEGG